MKIVFCEGMLVDGRRYYERVGMEGPLLFKGMRVLYWDRVDGKYYDPTTDLHLTQEQADRL